MKKIACLILGLVLMFTMTACFETDNTYTVSYAFNGKIYEIEVKSNSLYQIESIPEQTGYDFLGLFDEREGGTQYVDSTGISVTKYTLKEDIVLYPQFAAKKYTVMLDYRGGQSQSGVTSLTAEYGGEMPALPTDAQLEHNSFVGWFTEENGNGEQIADTVGVLSQKKTVDENNYDLDNNGRIYLYAHYSLNTYKVTFRFEDEDNTVIERFGVYNESISDIEPVMLVSDRYVMDWSTQKNDTTMSGIAFYVTGDMTLYPCRYGYGITLRTDTYETFTVVIANAGDEITLPAPERDGYVFLGWTTEGGEMYSDKIMPAENITLLAKWTVKLPVIILNENGGSDVEDITAEAGSGISLPVTSRNGYSFAGWYTESGEKYTQSVMPEKDITLIARWYKTQSVTVTLTDGTKSVSSSHTPMIFTIDLSQYLDSGDSTFIRFKVNYNLKVNSYFFIGAPTYFVFLFHNRNEVNTAYQIGDAVCRWSGEYGSCSADFSTTLNGNKIYISADSNTWAAGYSISNFTVTMTFNENKLV